MTGEIVRVHIEDSQEQDQPEVEGELQNLLVLLQTYQDEELPAIPRSRNVTLNSPIPSIVAAYRYHGDVNQADAVSSRFFVPMLVNELEVRE